MVRIDVNYLDNLSINCKHEPSGTEIRTAAPKDNNGDGSSFSPTDLLANAALTCIMTIIAISARNNNYSIDGMTGSVEKHMESSPRRVGQLDINIKIPQDLNEKEQKLTWIAAKGCPVVKSLHPDLKISLNIHFQ